MITAAILGIGLIFLMAGVVGVVDAHRTSAWREVAADRRQVWENGQRGTAAPVPGTTIQETF